MKQPSASAALLISGTPPTATADAFNRSRLRELLVFLVAMKVAGIVLIFDPWGFQSFDLPKTIFSHAVAWLLGAVLLAALVVYGHGIVPRTRLHLAVAAYVVVNVVSALAAENRYVAVFGDHDRYLGLTFLADMVVLYLAIAVSFRSIRDVALCLAALAVSTSFTFLYAGVQVAGLDPIPWLEPAAQPFMTAGPTAQPFSTLGNPDMLGHFLSTVFGLGLLLAVAPQLKLATTVRVIAGIGTLACVGLASVVAARGSVVGMGAALVALAVLQLRAEGISRSAISKQLVLILVAGGLSVLVLVLSPLGARMANVVDDRGSGRLALYDAAVQATLARPLLGWGPDNFASAYPSFRQPRPYGGSHSQSSAHDWLLQASVTTGGIGLAVLLALLATFARSLWRVVFVRAPLVAAPLFAGLAAYYAQALVSVGSISVDWFPWVCFGVIVAIVGRSSATRARRLGPLIASPVALLVSAGVLVSGVPLQSNRDAGAARAELNAGLTDRAIASAEAAVDRDPGRAVYWNLLGLALDKAGRWREAATAYEAATLRAPHQASYWSGLALARRSQALENDDPQAAASASVQAAQRAVEVDPYGPRVNESLADLAYEFGEFDIALRAAVKTALLTGGDPAYGQRAFLAASKAADLAGSRRLLEDAVTIEATAELHLALAVMAQRMSDHGAARESALRALALAPDNEEAVRLLAQLDR